MRYDIAAFALFFTASISVAQSQPYDGNAGKRSPQQQVVESVNLAPPRPATMDPTAPRGPAQPAVASGIGPSSNMAPQPGDYGYSAMNDLRQLNF